MSLLASQNGEGNVAIFALIVLGAIAYTAYHAYVFFCRPELWAEMQRRKHEREMAAAEERKAKAGRVVGGIAGGVAKALLGAAIGHKRHG